MADARRKAVAEHRKRLKSRGLARIELRAPAEDAALLREVAAALADPDRAAHTRIVLRELFAVYRAKNFKEFLAAAPLEGVDLERSRDTGREVDFDQ
ncbi:MAG: hypothetical protein AB7H90_05105 [Alphaproteobacteria bacterium]